MIVRCLVDGCGHAALIDRHRYFTDPRDWSREGPSIRFRRACRTRQAPVEYTRYGDAREDPLSRAAPGLIGGSVPCLRQIVLRAR
jgi:hypothetical protein